MTNKSIYRNILLDSEWFILPNVETDIVCQFGQLEILCFIMARFGVMLRRRQSQKSLLVWKFTCKIKNGISVKDIDTSGYIVA